MGQVARFTQPEYSPDTTATFGAQGVDMTLLSDRVLQRRTVLGAVGALGAIGVGRCAPDSPVETDEPTSPSSPQPSSPQPPGATPTGEALGTSPAAPSGTQPGPSSSALYVPPATGDWQAVTADEVGWDGSALDAAVEFAGDNASTAMMIVVGGRILAEQYWSGTDAGDTLDVASVQKSVTSTLVGIAADSGYLSVESPVTEYLGSGWSEAGPSEGAIEIRHLMSMSSGLDETLRLVAAPDTTWLYNTPAYAVLAEVLDAATGSDIQQFSTDVLFGPIGMTAEWQRRRSLGRGAPQGLVITARDMARFGLLIQARGRWGGRQIVSQSYLASALESSQSLNPSYGWLWWLNGQSAFRLPGSDPRLVSGPLVPSAPADMVSAMGAGDQRIYVSSADNVVVVRQGRRTGRRGDEAVSSFDAQLWELIVAAMPPG